MSKKVALISPNAVSSNGYGNITLNICRSYHQKGINFLLYLPHDHKRLDEPFIAKVRYILPSACYSFESKKILLDFTFRLSKIEQCDIVHCLFACTSSIIAMRLAKKRQIPFILGEQGTYAAIPFMGYFSSKIIKQVVQTADLCVFPSNFTKMVFCNNIGGQEIWKRAHVIPNGVEFDRFHSAKKNYSTTIKTLVGVGALKPRKGFEYVIKSLAKICKTHPDLVYHIVGAGSKAYEESLKALVASLNLEENVKFRGEQTGQQLIDILRNSDLYVHTPASASWNFEGFGIVYLEANACGLPVVGSESGGVSAAIQHGYNGYIVPERDSEALSGLLLKLLNQRITDDIRASCIEHAKKHDWSNIAEKFISLYKF